MDFSILYYPIPSGLRITGSNWNRKLVPKLVQFCSNPMRSDPMLIFLSGNRPLRGHIKAAETLFGLGGVDVCLRLSPFVSVCLRLSPFVSVCLRLSPFVSVCLRLSPFVRVEM